MMTARAYAQKYNLRASTVCKWARMGRLPGIQARSGHWQIPDEPPPPSILVAREQADAQGRIRCGTCKRRRVAVEHFTKSGVEKLRCKDCARIYAYRPGHPEYISLKQDIAIGVWLESAGEAERARRELELEMHAVRIEAAGLCGDGKDWLDG